MGGQTSRKKEQELSLAPHSEQLKTEHADRKTGKRGSNGRARRVYCKLAKGGEGGGERSGEGPKKTPKNRKKGGGRGGKGRQVRQNQGNLGGGGRGGGKWTQKTGVSNQRT